MRFFRLTNKTGAATIIIAVLLMVSATLIALYAAEYAMNQKKVLSNSQSNLEAFEAAEAGLEFGINYLNTNSAAILASPAGGYIQPYTSASTTNVSLSNGSKFSIVYSNPIANNYTLILLVVTGTNKDGTATRIISQRVQHGSLLFNTPQNPLLNIADVTLTSNSIVKNTLGNLTIQSGSTTTLTESAKTVLSTGTSSTASFMGSDIKQNLASLAATTSTNFFASYFGITSAAAKTKASYIFSNLSNYNSVLNGLTGTTIWIDQPAGTASIRSSTQLGTAAAPVLLFVNGNLSMGGQASITGLVVLMGTSSSVITGSAQINGGIISISSFKISGNSLLNFNTNVLSNLQNVTNTYYAKVPGSWSDF